jgi:hypothetical protein
MWTWQVGKVELEARKMNLAKYASKYSNIPYSRMGSFQSITSFPNR